MRCIAIEPLKLKGKRVEPGATLTLDAKTAAELIGLAVVVEDTADTQATLAQLEAKAKADAEAADKAKREADEREQAEAKARAKAEEDAKAAADAKLVADAKAAADAKAEADAKAAADLKAEQDAQAAAAAAVKKGNAK